MRMLFVFPDLHAADQPGPKYGQISFAIACLSAALKKAGHTVSLAHFLERPNHETFIHEIKYHQPDLIGFSVTEEDIDEVQKWISWAAKEQAAPIILGGAYPTLNPEEAIRRHGVDMICLGEGENPLDELCGRIRDGRNYDDVGSLWLRNGEQIKRNPVMPLEEDLDRFPMMDFDLFQFDKLHSSCGQVPRIYFKASRGCPFKCTYCVNHAVKELYPNQSHYVRFYSPERTIQMLEKILEIHPNLGTVQFADDILTLNMSWVREFFPKYKKRIGLPFRNYVHLGLINEEIVALLKDAGCYRVNCGVEAANDRIRNQVMNRKITQTKMQRSLKIIKDAGLQIHGSFIIGNPSETPQEAWDNIAFAAANPIDIPVVSILNPFEGTRIYQEAQKSDLLKPDKHALNKGTRLRLKHLPENKLQFYFSSFRAMILLQRRINRLPFNLRTILTRIIRTGYCRFPLPYALLNHIHDRYLNEYILTRIYRHLEKDLITNRPLSNHTKADIVPISMETMTTS